MDTMKHQARRFLLGLIALALLGCADVHGVKPVKQANLVKEHPMTLWELIAGLEKQMPLTISKVEAVTGGKFSISREMPAYVVLESNGWPLADGVAVSRSSLMVRPSLQFEDNSGLSLELEGSCIALSQVRERFGDLTLVQAPRGRSLDETRVWGVPKPWGHLSFAFQERRPDCLFRVAFHKTPL
jgi:hypothetical protein